MAFPKYLLIVLASVLVLGKCAFVDTLKKCQLKDEECLKKLFVNILNGISGSGISEYNIPPIDPLEIKDMDISVLGLLNMTIVEGKAKGIKDCVVKSFVANVDTLQVSVELTCDIVIKGKYKIESSADSVRSLIGNFHGEGNGKVKIDKITIKIVVPIAIEKRGDDTFLRSDLKKYKYSFVINGKVTFGADRLYLGDKESSKEIVSLMNENWRALVDAYGIHFLDAAMKVMDKCLQNFLLNVATKYYIVDDLTPYVH